MFTLTDSANNITVEGETEKDALKALKKAQRAAAKVTAEREAKMELAYRRARESAFYVLSHFRKQHYNTLTRVNLGKWFSPSIVRCDDNGDVNPAGRYCELTVDTDDGRAVVRLCGQVTAVLWDMAGHIRACWLDADETRCIALGVNEDTVACLELNDILPEQFPMDIEEEK
jgi:hypothetical protein